MAKSYLFNPLSGQFDLVDGGILTVGTFGSAPNADGAIISGTTLILEPADATRPGSITAGTQTIGGAKTFASTITASNLSGTNTGDQTITLTGAVTGSGTGSFATSLGSFTSAQLATALTDETGTGAAVFASSPTLVTPALGTPSALVGTNITGTASGLTAGNVTTNANLTGPITSVGNATSIASQTGTGTTFVMNTSPTLVTPVIGAATGTSLSVSGQLTSTVVTGTAPLVVSSTTRVSNLNVATAGNADTVTTNANLTGHITSVGNAAVLGSFTSAQLATALTDETGTGAAVFASSPTLVTPALGTPSALVGTNITGTAAGLTVGGNLLKSTGDIDQTSFAAANNQSATNVTGLAFANGSVRAFEALVSVYINATSSLYEVFTLRGIQKGSSWDMAVTSNGDVSGIVFSITTAGQVQYTSGNSSGFVSSTIKFRALSLAV